MVSLEVFGLGGKKATKMEFRIFDQFRGKEYAEEIVVVIHNSTARSIQMITQPFIRICGNPNNVLARKIEEKLVPLGLKLQRLAIATTD